MVGGIRCRLQADRGRIDVTVQQLDAGDPYDHRTRTRDRAAKTLGYR